MFRWGTHAHDEDPPKSEWTKKVEQRIRDEAPKIAANIVAHNALYHRLTKTELDK